MAKRKGVYVGPDLNLDMTPLIKGVPVFDAKLDRGVAGVMEFYDSKIESYMKTNAPWTDRTGNARSGLRAQAGHLPFVSHWVDLYHSVPYGIWLEVRFAARYSIVIPSMVRYAPMIMGTLTRLIGRLK